MPLTTAELDEAAALLHEAEPRRPLYLLCRPCFQVWPSRTCTRPSDGTSHAAWSPALAATEAVAPALEIVDSRIHDWKITLPDTIADNASSAALLHGPWTPSPTPPNSPRSRPTS